MSDADELAKLAAMHAAGSLSDSEFATAKARLLSDARDEVPAPQTKSRRRLVVIASVVALVALGATAALVASRSDSPSTAEGTQPTIGPTASHPPLILAPPSTRPSAPASFDPRTATPAERFAKFNELIHLYGSVGQMTEAEALDIAGNYCDNTVDDMVSFLRAVMSIKPLDKALAEAAAMADAYCPQQRVVVEAAMSELGITEPLPTSG